MLLWLTRDGQASTRRLLMWFVLTAILPASALAWFGFAAAPETARRSWQPADYKTRC